MTLKSRRFSRWLPWLVLAFCSTPLYAEEAIQVAPPETTAVPAPDPSQPQPSPQPTAAQARGLLVLPSTDTSQLGLASPLQYALAQLYQQSQLFEVKLSSYALNGFTEDHLRRAFGALGTSILSFVYLEKERVSIFLFDPVRPKQFIVASQPLADPTKALSSELIEERFRKTFAEVIKLYTYNNFQALPGASVDPQTLAEAEEAEAKRRREEARTLFRELSTLQDRTYYVGTNIGMARFSDATEAASTVNFGLLGGMKATDSIRVELGVDMFSYAMAHLDGRYVLPIAEKYVTVSMTLGISKVLGALTQNRGYLGTTLPSGAMMFGPGAGFEIPLLGANIRGELRMYFGGGTVLLGSYGIVYAI